MSSPGAGLVIADYRTRTKDCKKRTLPHAAGGQVERGLCGHRYSRILINTIANIHNVNFGVCHVDENMLMGMCIFSIAFFQML